MKRLLILLSIAAICVSIWAGTSDPDSISQLYCDTPDNLTGPVHVQPGGTFLKGMATAWDGSAFGCAWVNNSSATFKLFFARIATDGTLLTQPTVIASGAFSPGNASIVWTGTEYGIAWHDYRNNLDYDIYLARVSLTGEATEYRITTDGSDQYNPSLVWTGSDFGLAWQDLRNGNYDIYLARVSTSGDVTEYEVTTDPNGQEYPSLTWNGTGFGVAWEDYRNDGGDIYFAKVSPTGTVAESRITTNSYEQKMPSMVWTGTEYGIAWTDTRNVNWDIYMGRVTADGALIGEYQETSAGMTEAFASLAWTGSEYGVAWTDDNSGNYDLYFGRIDASGTRVGSDVFVYTMGESQTFVHYLAFGERGFGLIWNLANPKSVRFTYLGCHADSTEPTCPTSPAEIGRTNTSVTLGWGPARDNESGVSRYELYKDGSYLGTTADLSYTDSAFDPAAGSVYWIDSVNAVGLYSTGCASVDTTDAVAPTCAENLLATGVTETSATLHWLPSQDALSGLHQYIVYRDSAQLATVPAGTETYTDSTLTGGNTYNFSVRAEDYAGNLSALCATSRVWVSTSPITLMMTKDADGVNVDLDWTDVSLNEYVVYRSTDPQTASEHDRVSVSQDTDPVLHDGVRVYYYYIQQRGM